MTKEETLKDMQKIMEKMRIAISNNHILYKRMLHEGFDVLYSEALYDAGYRKEEGMILYNQGYRKITKNNELTNKWWLLSLSDKDLATLCLNGLREYSCQDINSLLFITEWLNEPYDEKLMKKAFPYLECWEKE